MAVKGGQTVFAGGFGLRRLDPDLPVTDQTVFAHGSTGKAFTSFLVERLVGEGLVAWDAPVRDYLPELRLADATVAERVTLRDLLAHRSGLARHDLAWIANPSWTRRELVARLRHLPLGGDLRQAWQYSNFGYVLAGHVAEVVTGSSYGDLLRRHVFEPLGFERTFVATADMQALDDHAEPYRVHDGKAVPIPMRPLDNAAPAGGVMSCARDTARWLHRQLEGGETHRLAMPFPAQTDHEFEVSGYALGWCVGTYRGRPLVWHNGGVDGFYTEFLLLPADGIAVGTCNNAGRPISAAIARHVADLLLGAEPRDWGAHLREQQAQAEAAAPQPEAVAGTRPSHPLEEYAGRYSHPGYGDLTFEAHDRDLEVRLGELEFRAGRRHYDTWDLSFATLGDSATTATFYTDPGGAVSDVFLPLEPGLEPIRFRRSDADAGDAGARGGHSERLPEHPEEVAAQDLPDVVLAEAGE